MGEAAPKKDAAPKKEAAPKKDAAPKKGAAASPKGGGAIDEDAIKAIGDELRVLKERLKGEGVTGKKLNENAEVKALVDKLNEAKAGGVGAAAPKDGGKKDAAKKDAGKKDAKEEKGGADADRKAQLKKVIKEGGNRGVEIEGAADR